MPDLYAAVADVLASLGTDILDDLAKDTDGGSDYTLTIIESMSREADSYIGARYDVPLTAATAIECVKPHVVKMARWMLLERRFSGRYDVDGARWLYEKALDWLKDVRDKKNDILGAIEKGSTASTAAGYTSWTSNAVAYKVGTARGF